MIHHDRRIAGDRTSVFPYDRRRSQNFLRSAICDRLRSYGNQPLPYPLFDVAWVPWVRFPPRSKDFFRGPTEVKRFFSRSHRGSKDFFLCLVWFPDSLYYGQKPSGLFMGLISTSVIYTSEFPVLWLTPIYGLFMDLIISRFKFTLQSSFSVPPFMENLLFFISRFKLLLVKRTVEFKFWRRKGPLHAISIQSHKTPNPITISIYFLS